MTLLPVDQWSVEALPTDTHPAYALNTVCAHPHCAQASGLDNHHLWRRSFGKGFREAWWVSVEQVIEYDDGSSENVTQVVPNRVHLCNRHHLAITDNRARITWDSVSECFRWTDIHGGEGLHEVTLKPQPGAPVVLEHVHVEEGQECPACHRRVPHKKKPSSPKTKVLSVRFPLDGADEVLETLDAAARHMGILEKPHHRAEVILKGAVLILQEPPGTFH